MSNEDMLDEVVRLVADAGVALQQAEALLRQLADAAVPA
jgi:hypothetical protein